MKREVSSIQLRTIVYDIEGCLLLPDFIPVKNIREREETK